MFEQRSYVIITVEQAQLIDFDQVLESGLHTMRYSLDSSKTFVKYEGERPSSVPAQAPAFTHSEILEILQGPVWFDANASVFSQRYPTAAWCIAWRLQTPEATH